MTIADMFGQSAIVTLLGMGVVFGFLIILIVSITLAGKIIHALGLDKDMETPVKAKVPSPASAMAAPSLGTANNAGVTAAIAAALTEYRRTHS